VATRDAASAKAADQNIQKDILSDELRRQGLPEGKVLSSTIKVEWRLHSYVFLWQFIRANSV
jgi:hypothetical protein